MEIDLTQVITTAVEKANNASASSKSATDLLAYKDQSICALKL